MRLDANCWLVGEQLPFHSQFEDMLRCSSSSFPAPSACPPHGPGRAPAGAGRGEPRGPHPAAEAAGARGECRGPDAAASEGWNWNRKTGFFFDEKVQIP